MSEDSGTSMLPLANTSNDENVFGIFTTHLKDTRPKSIAQSGSALRMRERSHSVESQSVGNYV